MLILGRKEEESIMLGDDIEIIIIGISEDSVRIGIKAPKSLGVHRKEIYKKIKKNPRGRMYRKK